jgi:hypothetical protein
MLYRGNESGTYTLKSGREVSVTRGERIDSRQWMPEDLAELEDRFFIIPEDDVESATAAPGERRSTRRKSE